MKILHVQLGLNYNMENLFGKSLMALYLFASFLRVFLIKFFNPYVKIDFSCHIERGVFFDCKRRGSVTIGKNTTLKRFSMITPLGGYIKIGSNCSVNAFTIIHGAGGVEIGDNVAIAPQCMIVSQNHNYADPDLPIIKQPNINKKITICNDVWIGSGAKILAGVTIAEGCVIGSNAVVTKDTQAFGVYAGVPAKLIKLRK